MRIRSNDFRNARELHESIIVQANKLLSAQDTLDALVDPCFRKPTAFYRIHKCFPRGVDVLRHQQHVCACFDCPHCDITRRKMIRDALHIERIRHDELIEAHPVPKKLRRDPFRKRCRNRRIGFDHRKRQVPGHDARDACIDCRSKRDELEGIQTSEIEG